MLMKSSFPGLRLTGPGQPGPSGLTDTRAAQKKDLYYLCQLVTPPGDRGLKQESVSVSLLQTCTCTKTPPTLVCVKYA